MEVAKFSPGGEYLGVSGSDGRLRIWDASTSVLKQEFIPPSHLTATCTCLEWSPPSNQTVGKKKKRKKAIAGDVVVMGTTTGGILFYGVTKAQLLSQHKDAHASKVTDLTWSASSLLVYSVGSDGNVCEWDVEEGSMACRWRASKSGISAVKVFQTGLLTASHGITLWDLGTKTASRSFSGHPSLINQLEVIPNTDYFVTMCHTERHLRIWSRNEQNSVLTLTVPEPPQRFSVANPDNGQVCVATVTQTGSLHLFKHKLNGPVKKPLLPAVTLKIQDSANTSQLPLLASFLAEDSNDSDIALVAAYGNWLRLRFERFPVGNLEQETIFQREYSLAKKKGKKSIADDTVQVPSNVKHLQPDMPSDLKPKKRKHGEEVKTESVVDDGELPMEERLTNLTINTPSSGTVPNSNNLSNLLSQGLHSKDTKILHSVLSRWDETVISVTVRSLPVQLIIPLLKEIRGMLGGKAQMNHSLLKWLKIIFQVHSSYLMSCPSGEELLGPFMNLLRSREALYPQMCQLKGKLELIKGNIQAKEFKAEQPNEALLVYHDESSDEDREDDAILQSDTENNLETDDDLGVEDTGSSDNDEESDMDEDDDKSNDQSGSDEELQQNSKPKSIKKSNKVNNHVNDSDDDLMEDSD